MKTKSIFACGACLGGRYDKTADGFTMDWPGSYARLLSSGSRLDVEIEAVYGERRDYLSFEVDGLRAQTFSPLEGRHWYTVYLGMEPKRDHNVRVIKETMAFPDRCSVRLTRVRTDGEFKQAPVYKKRIEFIGDSITCGEGCRGPEQFDEWLPMMFGASDAFPRMTADAAKAEYNCVSISGWGVLNGWDNNPDSRIPAIYDKLCGQKSDLEYAFDFDPHHVVVALGTNDNNALTQPPYTDPESGRTNKFTDSPDDLERLTEAAEDFLRHLHEKNPHASLLWISFYKSGVIHDALQKAVEAAAVKGIDARFAVPADLYALPRGGMGSRYHPGPVTHRMIAKELKKLLK